MIGQEYLVVMLSLCASGLDVQAISLQPGSPVELDPAQPSELQFAAESSGRAVVWVSAKIPLTLRVEGEVGLLGEAMGSSGAPTPCVEVDVSPGDLLRIHVEPEDPEASSSMEVRLTMATETEETLAAARAGQKDERRVGRLDRRGDDAEAKELARSTLETLLSTPGSSESAAIADAIFELGRRAFLLNDAELALQAWTAVRNHRERKLPRDHIDALRAWNNIGVVMRTLGNVKDAVMILEEVVSTAQAHPRDDEYRIDFIENLAQTYLHMRRPEDAIRISEELVADLEAVVDEGDPRLQRAHLLLSGVRSGGGASEGLLAQQEQTLAMLIETRGEDAEEVQVARMFLAATLKQTGDLERARDLEAAALAFWEEQLEDGSPRLEAARMQLGSTLLTMGDPESAVKLMERALEGFSATLPDDDQTIASVRQNLAVVMKSLGDTARARELEELVLAARLASLEPTNILVQEARSNLAGTLMELGHVRPARRLLDRAVSALEQTRPPDDPTLAGLRQNLAGLMIDQGDYYAAREVLESAIAVYEKRHPPGHPGLQTLRFNLHSSLMQLGELEPARELIEDLHAQRSRTMPTDSPELFRSRLALATVLVLQGELRAALGPLEEALSNTRFPESHAGVQRAVFMITKIEWLLGDRERAVERIERLLELQTSALSPDDPDRLRTQIAGALFHAIEGDRDRGRELGSEMADGVRESIRKSAMFLSARELEEQVQIMRSDISLLLALVAGGEEFEGFFELEAQAFAAVEAARSVGLQSSRARRAAGPDVRASELRADLREASARVAGLVMQSDRTELFEAIRAKEQVERHLLEHNASLTGVEAVLVEGDVEAMGRRLRPKEAAVGFWMRVVDPIESTLDAEVALTAFVVRPDAPLRLVELGPVEPIEDAVREWLAALGLGSGMAPSRGVQLTEPDRGSVGEEGARVRELVLDPLLSALGETSRLTLALDGVLHLVPFEAIPLEDGIVGDRFQVVVRSTLWELLSPVPELTGEPEMLVVGGLDYGSANVAPEEQLAGIFAPLPATADEAIQVAELFTETVGNGRRPVELKGTSARLEPLLEAMAGARFIHLATHGFFMADPRGRGTLGLYDAQAPAMAPMSLCGLALSGANAPTDFAGHTGGIVTAEELATLDLSDCELALLSACDTSVGLRRAGQGVASLQKALHMAGARSVITSLWKVPDEATRELIVEFYRRLWVHGESKSRALWEAKQVLRRAVGPDGTSLYGTRDWAGWVLTGEPD